MFVDDCPCTPLIIHPQILPNPNLSSMKCSPCVLIAQTVRKDIRSWLWHSILDIVPCWRSWRLCLSNIVPASCDSPTFPPKCPSTISEHQKHIVRTILNDFVEGRCVDVVVGLFSIFLDLPRFRGAKFA